jgi:hypothetical protein
MYTFFELQIKNFSFLLNTQKHLSVSENFKSTIQIWVPQDMGNMISQHSNQAMVWAIQGSVSIKSARDFSLLQNIQTSCGAHPASSFSGYWGIFP